MEDRDWHILKTLYIHKNITKTAESLYVSQSSLTIRLRQIEEEFGFEIVERGVWGVRFTPKGEFLAKSADRMIMKMEEIRKNVADMKNKVIGTLKLGVSNHFTKYKLPDLLKEFKVQYPNVELEVITGWSKDIIQLLTNQKVHLAIVSGDDNWQHQKHLILEDPLCIASKDEVHINDLPRLSRIDYEAEIYVKALVDNWWEAHFSKPPLIGMEVDRENTCKEVVKNGLGYAILPNIILNNAEEIKKVVLKDNFGQPIMINTWLYYYQDFLNMNIVSAFVSFIKENPLNQK
ncbi:LysR family transcriptional regulator [Anaerobacillus sp. MEB173]|uniref:LysR family transcriptional regulator n=1 Tax=Anaerobacillus sp. MEB173 TaxID=3383345 RepID=UPI003F91E1B8